MRHNPMRRDESGRCGAGCTERRAELPISLEPSLLEAGMVDVTALGMRRPDPAFLGRTSALPSFFKYEPDSRSHGKYTACCSCFALSYSSSVPLLPVRSSEPRTYVCSISGRAAVAGNTEKSSLCSRIRWPCLRCSHAENRVSDSHTLCH
jgi:hypothetical protein